jgi:transcription antitermination factor NusG
MECRVGAEWLAVYTKHQHEKSVAALLERKGIEHFLPLYQTVNRWKDRNQRVSLPLFPCYLFVRLELGRKLEVLQTAGVRWFVENAGHACAVPEPEINDLRRVCESGVRIGPHPFLQKGDQVLIRKGPLAGIEGILKQVRSEHCVILSVELLKRSVAVEVSPDSVQRLAPQKRVSQAPSPEVTRKLVL